MADEATIAEELRALAGVKKGDTFSLKHRGVDIEVVWVSGSSSSLTLGVKYDAVAQQGLGDAGYRGAAPLVAIRPLAIVLTPEQATHRRGKAEGLDVEVQTGDPPFDDAVYVDTMAPAHVVQRVLGPEVRQAVLELFALEFNTIVIDDAAGRVTAVLVSFTSRERPARPGRRAADAFARIASSLPRVAAADGAYPKHPLRAATAWLAAGLIVALVGAAPAYCSTNPRCTEDMTLPQTTTCAGPGIVGMVCGVVAMVVVGVLAARVTRRHRGRSDSSSQGGTFGCLAMLLAFVVVSTLVGVVINRL